jgi:hypothetical protein
VATSREEGVDRVLGQVPEGWTARPMDDCAEGERDEHHGFQDIAQDIAPDDVEPGEIRELSSIAVAPRRAAAEAGRRRKPLTRP